jgi:cytochrome c biogenesis protein CcmG/thiol:disulfide interchange protein DsbE
MKIHLNVRGIAAIALLISSAGSSSADITAALSRKEAPTFARADATGATVKLSDYRGKVVLLDFWATWCTGCKVEIPWYVEFQKKYQRRGLVAVGVAMDDDGWKLVRPYLREHPISYPVVLGDAELAALYHVTAMPMTLLIDRSGRIADAHVGMVDKNAWEHEIRQLLLEKVSAR